MWDCFGDRRELRMAKRPQKMSNRTNMFFQPHCAISMDSPILASPHAPFPVVGW
jgi:hypothetical protein